MEAVYLDSQYMGVTIQEATYGGIFMSPEDEPQIPTAKLQPEA